MVRRAVIASVVASLVLAACMPEFVRIPRADSSVEEDSQAGIDAPSSDVPVDHDARTNDCGGDVPCGRPVDAPTEDAVSACDVGTRCNGACVDVQTNPDHCGACGRRCALANASATCASGQCRLMACREGFSDCDANEGSGCETHHLTDRRHCGACGRSCAVLCASGACVGAAQIVGAQTGTCARMADGTVWCWELGATRATRTSFSGAVDVAISPFGVCAIVGAGAGEVQCEGSVAPSATIRDATRVACGDTHCCALLRSGGVVCWGDNSLGSLGDGTMNARTAPVTVAGLQRATQIALGCCDTCALYENGGGGSAGFCWGPSTQLTPGRATALDGATSIYGGPGLENSWCGIFNAARDLRCGSHTMLSPTPVLSNVVSVSGGAAGRCAVQASGTAYCWGGNLHGFLGNGGTAGSMTPVPVSGLTDAVSVTSGYLHSCAIRRNGSVVCWGAGRRLPDRTLEAVRTPVPVLFE